MDQDQCTRNQWVSELSTEERELFFMLPDWHRQVFINYPCPWELLEKSLFGGVTPKSPDDIGNKQLVIGSIRMVLAGDEEAVNLWLMSEKARELGIMNNEMPISLLICLVFPLIAYFERADGLAYLISMEIQKEVININELKKIVDTSQYLGTEGIICLHIWEKYLHDKEEYLEFHRKKQIKIASDYKNEIINLITARNTSDGLPSLKRKHDPVIQGNRQAQIDEMIEAFHTKYPSKKITPQSVWWCLDIICPDWVERIETIADGQLTGSKVIMKFEPDWEWRAFKAAFKRYQKAHPDL